MGKFRKAQRPKRRKAEEKSEVERLRDDVERLEAEHSKIRMQIWESENRLRKMQGTPKDVAGKKARRGWYG